MVKAQHKEAAPTLEKLLYPLVKGLVYLWSLLPMRVLYIQSDCLAFFAARIMGYRKQVIHDNLSQSFPEKNEAEIRALRMAFYRHFCDVIVETVKLASISAPALKKRVRHLNPEVIPDMVAHGGGGIAIFSHYANWEWLGSGMGVQLPFGTVGVYKPLKNKVFDRLVRHIRTRLGNDMITQAETYRESLIRLKKPCYIAFLGDQTPFRTGKLYFGSFFGRPAAVHLGIARIALKLECPLYYFDMRKVKRGRYTVTLRRVPVEDFLPFSEENVAALTDHHLRMLEEIMRAEPAYWLWSHKRWKRKPMPSDRFSPTLKPLKSNYPGKL